MQTSPFGNKHNQLMPQYKLLQYSSFTKNATISNALNNIVTDLPRSDSTDRQTSKKRSSKQQQIDSQNGISLRNSMKFASKRMAQGQERQVPISIQFSPSIPQLSSPSLKMRGGAATTTTTVATPTTATTEASMKGSISMLKQFTQQNAPSNTIHSKILSFLDKKTSIQHLQKIGKSQNNNRNNSGSRIGTSSPEGNRQSWSNSNNNNTFQHQNNFDNHHHNFLQHPQSASTNNLSCLNKPVVWFQDSNSTSNRCILNSSCTAAMNTCQNNQSNSNFYDQVARSSSNSNNIQAPKHHYLSESQLKHAINGNLGGLKPDKVQQQHIDSSLKRQVTPSQNSQNNRIEPVIYHPKASLNHGFRQKIKSRKNRKNRKTNSMTMCTTQESQDSFFENILSSGKKLVYSPQTRDINPIQEIPQMNQQFKGKMNPQKKLIPQISTSPQHNLENGTIYTKMQNITFYPTDETSGQVKEDEIVNYNSNSLNNFEILEESKSGKKNKKNIKDERYKNYNEILSQSKQQTSERNLQRILLAQSQDSILLPSFQRNQQSQTHLSMSPPKEQSIPNSNSFIHSNEEITPSHMQPPCWCSLTKQRMSSRTQQDDKDTHISYPSQDNQNKEINSLTQSDIDQALMSFRNLLASGQENPISIHNSLTSQSNRDTYSPQRVFLHNFPRLSNALTQSQYSQYEEILSIGVQTHQLTEDFGQLMVQFAEKFIKPVPKLVRSTQQLVTQSMRKDEEIKKLREKVLLLKKENDKGNGNQHIKNAHLKEIIHTPSTQIDETPQVTCKQVQEVGFSEQNQVSTLQAELDKKTAIIAAMQEREKITQQFLEQLQKIGYLQSQQTQNIQENTLNCQMVNPIEQNKEQLSKDEQIFLESPSNQFSSPSNILEQQNGQHSQEIAPINAQISDRSEIVKNQVLNQGIDMQTHGEQEQQQIKNPLKNSSEKSSLKPSVNSSIVEQSAQQMQQQNQEENDNEEDEEDLADLEIQFQIQQMNNQLQQRQAKNSTIKTMSSINLSDNLKQKLKLDLSSLQSNGKSNSSQIVPPLGLPQVKQQPPAMMDYHDEFMSRIDEFSRSWRMAVIEEQQKYLSRDNQNYKQQQQQQK